MYITVFSMNNLQNHELQQIYDKLYQYQQHTLQLIKTKANDENENMYMKLLSLTNQLIMNILKLSNLQKKMKNLGIF